MFIRSPVGGCLVVPPVGVGNNAAVNTNAQRRVRVPAAVLLVVYLAVSLLDHTVVQCLTFHNQNGLPLVTQVQCKM